MWESTEHTNHDSYVEEWVDETVRGKFRETKYHGTLYCQYRRCILDLAKGALLLRNNAGWDANQLRYKCLEPIAEFVAVMAEVATGRDVNEASPNFWTHESDPISTVKMGTSIDVGVRDAAGVADTYLRLPVRATVVDRLLVDLMIYAEFQAFAREATTKDSISGVKIEKHRSIFVLWSIGVFGNALLAGVLCAVVAALDYISILASNWANGIMFVLGFIWLALAVIATVYLPFAWVKVTRKNTSVKKLLFAMNSSYRELDNRNSVSPARVHKVVSSAADQGVGWPAPLFTLLEDVEKRGATL